MLVKLDHETPSSRGENKKCLKPPPSFCFSHHFWIEPYKSAPVIPCEVRCLGTQNQKYLSCHHLDLELASLIISSRKTTLSLQLFQEDQLGGIHGANTTSMAALFGLLSKKQGEGVVKPPQIIHFNGVFHEINHPFLGYPYFSKHPFGLRLLI